MLHFLGRRLHSSWLITWLAAGALGGIAAAPVLGSPTIVGLAMAVPAAVLTVVGFAKHRTWSVIVLLIAGALIGVWRGGIEQLGLQRYKNSYGHTVMLQGVMSEDASLGPGGDQRLTLARIRVNGTMLNGQVWISSDAGPNVRRSDVVTLRGKLGPGFGGVAASMFHAQITSVRHPVPGDIGLAVRDWFSSGIRQAIPEPEASLAGGYLVGQRSALPPDLNAQLKTTGLTHAVVASGYNLTILVGVARRLLQSVSKYTATVAALALVVGFMAMSGLSPSMARAGLVTGLSLAAWYYGRRFHPVVLLICAAAVTALFDPFYVWGDIGWYLSFASFTGVIIIAPIIQQAFWRGRNKPGVVMSVVIDTMSAQLATMPIMILAFGQYSPYALLANLLVLPLVPLTMLLTFVAGTVSLLIPGLARLAGWPADSILRYMIWIIGHIAELPGATMTVAISGLTVALSYGTLVLAIVVLQRRLGFHFRQPDSASNP